MKRLTQWQFSAARWQFFAPGGRWHLVAIIATENGPLLAPLSVCGAARQRKGASWSSTAPVSLPYVRCASCRRLARKYLTTERRS